MLASKGSVICIEEIAKELEEIEFKYSPKSNKISFEISNDMHESLTVLSKEFDSLGLSPLKLEAPVLEVFKQVVHFSRALVHIHRNAIQQIKDQNIQCRTKDSTRNELYNKLEESKDTLEKYQEKCASLQNSTLRLNDQIKELHKRETKYKEQLDKVKRYYYSKEQTLEHSIRKLKMKNERLKELFGKDIVTKNSTNDVALKVIKKYKVNEEIYKTTITKLQENNRDLLDELLNLKEELILCNSKNEPMM